jgi:hypothetical protein
MALVKPPSNPLAPVTCRLQLAGHGSPIFYLTTTDAGGRFSKFSSPFSSAAPAPHPADCSFAKSAPALTAAGDRFQKSGGRPTDAGSRPAKSETSLPKSAGSFAKSAVCFAAAGTGFAKSADASPASEQAFSQLFAIEMPVFDQPRPVHPQISRPCSQTINHQPTTDYE